MDEVGDNPQDLICMTRAPHTSHYGEYTEPITVPFDLLPTTQFDAGYGGEEGEQFICWSPRFIYIKGIYDGAEWCQVLPRNPENADASHFNPVGGG